MRIIRRTILALALAFAGSAAARAQGVTIEHLSTGAALSGGELIPMYQGADPAVTTTPSAIASYVNSNLSLTINSGHTAISGAAMPGGSPTGSGLFLYTDTHGLLQAGGLYLSGSNGEIVENGFGDLLPSSFPSPPSGGFQIIAGAPTMVLSGIGSTGSAAPQFVGQNAYCDPCTGDITQSAVLSDATLVQLWGEGYTGTHYQIGAMINVVTTQNWSDSAQGAQMIFYVNPNNQTYGSGSVIETLDWQNGLALNSQLTLMGATPATSNGLSLGATTVAASNCGSLSGASGCWKFVSGSTAHYIPYY